MVISQKIQFRLNVLFITVAVLAITFLSLYSLGYLDELEIILAKDNYIFTGCFW
ncbi:hypothetical protein [Chryseobacterium indoltheticum]|uniref:hypothetical protein n=1 Tax=Chryseobacterium indoltheticum TaxID=254 RepID=UPI003F492A36